MNRYRSFGIYLVGNARVAIEAFAKEKDHVPTKETLPEGFQATGTGFALGRASIALRQHG